MKQRIRFSWKKFTAFILFNVVFTAVLAPVILFRGPFQSLKVMAVGAVATSRHPQVVRAFLSQEEIDAIMHEYDVLGVNTRIDVAKEKVISDQTEGITIEDIKGPNFKGKVMLIKDPKRIRVAVTKEIGVNGERVSDLVKDFNAVAGINAGGFYDPNGKGNGAFPDGLTVHDGKLVHNNVGDQPQNVIGFDDQGKLHIGDLRASELVSHNIQEAVSFYGPNLIINGVPQVVGDGGWGVAPRTGIGQRADGTVIFVVIDGRQPTWSWGATIRDLMNVFIDYHAVNAANLDGGSSSEMVYQGKVVNRLWDIFGERYIPTAFVVLPK